MSSAAPATRTLPRGLSFLQDTRFLQAASQIVFAIVVVSVIWVVAANVYRTLQDQNLTPNFAFMNTRSGFDIADAPPWYSSQGTFLDAYLVGLVNTIRVVSIGLVMSTVIGVFVGIFLLSGNFLLGTIARVYVEILRNTPLLVQLFVWYFVVMLSLPVYQQSLSFPVEGVFLLPIRWLFYPVIILAAWWIARRANQRPLVYAALAFLASIEVLALLGVLPDARQRIEVLPAFYANIKSIVFPEVWATGRFGLWLIAVVTGGSAAFVLYRRLFRTREDTGEQTNPFEKAFAVFAAVALISYAALAVINPPSVVSVEREGQTVEIPIAQAAEEALITPEQQAELTAAPLLVVLPVRGNFDFERGAAITPEFTALLLGLTIYTSAFIAEIVRAGIQAVPYGQVEAARSIGLGEAKVLRMIVLPQALRVIIPPLGNQYLNLAKNSSLAIAVAFADLFQVTTTIMNTSGQSVPGMLLVMVTYLILSLVIAIGTNLINRRIRLVAN